MISIKSHPASEAEGKRHDMHMLDSDSVKGYTHYVVSKCSVQLQGVLEVY